MKEISQIGLSKWRRPDFEENATRIGWGEFEEGVENGDIQNARVKKVKTMHGLKEPYEPNPFVYGVKDGKVVWAEGADPIEE